MCPVYRLGKSKSQEKKRKKKQKALLKHKENVFKSVVKIERHIDNMTRQRGLTEKARQELLHITSWMKITRPSAYTNDWSFSLQDLAEHSIEAKQRAKSRTTFNTISHALSVIGQTKERPASTQMTSTSPSTRSPASGKATGVSEESKLTGSQIGKM